jgi:hypothetical protein
MEHSNLWRSLAGGHRLTLSLGKVLDASEELRSYQEAEVCRQAGEDKLKRDGG